MLISQANLLTWTDKLAAAWILLLAACGSEDDDPPAAGTVRDFVNDALQISVVGDDYQMQADFNSALYDALSRSAAETVADYLQPSLAALTAHVAARGSSVDSSIVDLTAYLDYLHGLSAWAALVTPEFSDLMLAAAGSSMAARHVMSPSISPLSNAAAYPNGMGVVTYADAFTDGVAVTYTTRAAVELLAVVTTDFADGTAPPELTIDGLDQDGAVEQWTITLDADNPTSAIATTITPSVTGQARSTVAVASAAGIVRGSVLTVSAGDNDEETVVVEAVSGTDITAVFRLDHDAGAALTGRRTYAVAAPAAGVRCRDVTDITLTAAGHTAGAVRIDGRRDRVAI